MTKEVTQARIAEEKLMFGERPELFLARHKAYISMVGIDMFVCGLMSDAQEVMAHGNVEEARQFLNKAKLLLIQKMEGNL